MKRDVQAVELSRDGDRSAFEDQIDDGWLLETAVNEDVVRRRMIRSSHLPPLRLTFDEFEIVGD